MENTLVEGREDSQEYSTWGWEPFFRELVAFLAIINREISGSYSIEYACFVSERLSTCVRALSALCNRLEVQSDSEIAEVRDNLEGLKECCLSLRNLWQSCIDQLDANSTEGQPTGEESYHAPSRLLNGRGHPLRIIEMEQLEYLRSVSFSWTQISRLLGVSRMTVYRRRRDFGMLDESNSSLNISDTELYSLLVQMRRQMPNIGETLVLGRVQSMGYSVTRSRIRQMLHVTDPLNAALRWRGVITARRPYSVAAPNSLWHIGM